MPHDAAERDKSFSRLYSWAAPKYLNDCAELAGNLQPGDWDDEWLEDQQSDFILGIFSNLHSLVPLVLARRISDDGTPFTLCGDGQQRLLALRRFMDGSIPVIRNGVETWYKDAADAPGVDKPLLSDAIRNLFDEKVMICMIISDMKPSEEEEIVNRVRYGLAADPSVPFESIKTPRSDFVRMLCDHFLDPVMQDVLPWQDRKATDYTSPSVCVSQIVKTVDSGEANLDICELRTWLCQGDPIPPVTVESVKHTFSTFRLLVVDPQYNGVFRKSPPFTYVEFIGVALLISGLKELKSLRYIADRISEIRKDVMKDDELSRVNFDAIVRFIAEV
ncbi:hypothetical protein DFH06DRAFT_167478 [Mycena polygramma]|nr:hypothetical protein DFH06DRAFT_167478 [Mycena polygramma]